MQTLLPYLSRETSLAAIDTLPGKLTLAVAGSILVAFAAQISIPLPFTPVPFTLQPLAVLCVGLALGPVTGFVSMMAYLAEGAMGLPVFSPVGAGGIAQLLGPTGGFLMAYPFVAAIAGAVRGRSTLNGKSRFLVAFFACIAATVCLFFLGAGWFRLYTHLSLRATWLAAVLPFIPGELIKLTLAAGTYSAIRRPSRI